MSEVLDRLKAVLADRYRIERELGAGGMATVYLAVDLKHHRPVAIKVLKSAIAAPLGAERFLREIEIAARLTHPHILPLHDSGDAGGLLFYVMPFVEGESLRVRLKRVGQLAISESLRIAEQVAGALDYAHRQQVVHRDIKPENILLHEGSALIADFGIAMALDDASAGGLTQTGFSIGTPQYMSPEQVTGDHVDGRSDIYALGCVLYEMLTGEPPYTGQTAQAVIAKRLLDPVPSVRRLRREVPEHVALALERALARTPQDRFETASKFAEALSRLSPAAPRRGSIAVLPFANLSADPDNEYFSDGITEDLIAQISKVRDLKVISRTSTMRYKGTDKGLRQIGEELAVSTILEGSVRRAGNRVRVVAQLIDVATDEHLWADTYDRELTDVFAIQSDVALRVATSLEAALSPVERAQVAKRPTENIEAYDLYLLGRHQANKRSDEGLRRAIEYFERALEKDPAYAGAHAGLADAYVLSGIGYRAVPPLEAISKGREFAVKALELDEALPEAHAALGYAHICGWDWPRAREEFERAIALNPSAAQAHQWYGHYHLATRDFRSALEQARRARELDPLSVVLTNELGWPYHYMGRFEQAREHYLRAREMDPTFAMAHYNLANTYDHEGRYDEAIPIYETAVKLAGRLPFINACLAGAYARSNRVADAREIWREISEHAQRGYGLELWVAYVHEALGEVEKALEWLERAYDARVPSLPLIGSSWLPFQSVRGNPRFIALLDKMGVGSTAATTRVS